MLIHSSEHACLALAWSLVTHCNISTILSFWMFVAAFFVSLLSYPFESISVVRELFY